MIVTPLPPTLTKSFFPTTFDSGGTTTLTFTVNNPATNPALSNVGFADALPSGLRVAAAPAIGGTCANVLTPGWLRPRQAAQSITVAGLQAEAGASSCTVTVNITNMPGKGT